MCHVIFIVIFTVIVTVIFVVVIGVFVAVIVIIVVVGGNRDNIDQSPLSATWIGHCCRGRQHFVIIFNGDYGPITDNNEGS